MTFSTSLAVGCALCRRAGRCQKEEVFLGVEPMASVKRKGFSLGLNPWDLVSLCEDAWHSQESNR